MAQGTVVAIWPRHSIQHERALSSYLSSVIEYIHVAARETDTCLVIFLKFILDGRSAHILPQMGAQPPNILSQMGVQHTFEFQMVDNPQSISRFGSGRQSLTCFPDGGSAPYFFPDGESAPYFVKRGLLKS